MRCIGLDGFRVNCSVPKNSFCLAGSAGERAIFPGGRSAGVLFGYLFDDVRDFWHRAGQD